MRVSDLHMRLQDADPDAVVLLLPSYSDLTDANELVDVVLISEPWTCERHREADGSTTDVHHPASLGYTIGWNPARDESWAERVVILSPQQGNIEARFHGDGESVPDAASLADDIRERALQARRRMVADGRLLPADDFRARLGISKKRFGRMLEDSSIFSLDVDGTAYFPTLLAAPRLYRKRLQAICRIIAPAPAGSRLDFLSTPRGALGDRNPLEMLDDDSDYMRMRTVAEAWAAEYWRTSVTLYEGEHETEPSGVAPLYTAAAEIDSRKHLWARASNALHEHGYEWPLGPYPEYRAHTMFISRQCAGCAQRVPEACVQILAKDDFIRIRIVYQSGKESESGTRHVGNRNFVVDIAKKVIAHLRKR